MRTRQRREINHNISSSCDAVDRLDSMFGRRLAQLACAHDRNCAPISGVPIAFETDALDGEN